MARSTPASATPISIRRTGHEFSAVLGATYNLKNYTTDYQSGIDLHLDWGWSQFLTKQAQIGLVGYVYKQATCDSGAGNRVGCFESAGDRRWPADRLHHSGRDDHAGVSQSEGHLEE